MTLHNAPKGSRTAKITAIVGDDYYTLKLDFERLTELEEKIDKGAFYILRRMSDFDHGGFVGDFRIGWIKEVIRLGLIGGGMRDTDALKLTDRYLREGFALDYLQTATNALYAALHGPEQEPVVFDKVEPEGQPGEPEPEVVTPTPSDESNGENTGNSPGSSE